MKTIIYLTLMFISFSLSAQIQNNPMRFIEFTIEDTVIIEADKISYLVNFTYNIYMDDEEIGKDELKARKTLRKQARELTQKNLIEFANRNRIKFTSNPENQQNDYGDILLGMLEISNETNLKKQLDELAQIKHIKYSIVKKSSTSEAKVMKELTQRIIQKAKEKAQFYAQALQVKLGKILQVVEPHPNISNQAMTGGWVVYPPLSSLPITGSEGTEIYLKGNTEDTKIMLHKSILFRFEIE